MFTREFLNVLNNMLFFIAYSGVVSCVDLIAPQKEFSSGLCCSSVMPTYCLQKDAGWPMSSAKPDVLERHSSRRGQIALQHWWIGSQSITLYAVFQSEIIKNQIKLTHWTYQVCCKTNQTYQDCENNQRIFRLLGRLTLTFAVSGWKKSNKIVEI